MKIRPRIAAAQALRWAVGIFFAAAANAAAQGADAADEALKKGDLAEAVSQLEQTVKRAPADYGAILSYASTLPPKEALKIADSISRAPNAPGWAKARGLRLSGDHLFLKEEYKKAADTYLQASLLDNASTYRHLYALSIAMDGRTEAARTVWNGIALDKNDETGGEATRLLALLPAPAAATDAAIPVNTPNNTQASTAINTNAVKIDSVKTPSTPAAPVNPPVASANQQNNTVTVDSVKARSASTVPVNPPVAPVSQQNGASRQTTVGQPNNTPVPATSSAVTANTQAMPNSSKPAAPFFTIQVGAFASKENADNLVRRLTGKYDDITVSSTGSGDQTLYRVRVGSFQKKEDATAFADKLIIEAGLSARVTDK
ncbi:MAG: SPOR domain-containing protein [Chitinispirillales bacterium]|jgi:cell division protein FtsN|nr:SPOR domain-containing protein [Chitinispirillales bacterium]